MGVFISYACSYTPVNPVVNLKLECKFAIVLFSLETVFSSYTTSLLCFYL